MPSAKQLLAKLTRFLHRMKPSTTPRIMDDKQQARKSHKASNTTGEGAPLSELSSMPMDNELQPNDKELEPQSTPKRKQKPKGKHSANDGNGSPTRSPRSRSHRMAATTGASRMEAGYEDAAVQHCDGCELSEGPILETGISRMAFCRKLDSLLQRSLGVDVCHDRRWPKANGSYC
ncbi:hypothetical protein KR093_000903 [Drosophila rubida]|uniref:Uncharacterized protein n=1 Tax=Drosophila rubida TaxID=30044 RepID=A0AAD4KBT2_9MUSC|nr:hypothetical protein KR093_000903 [Drosophila rubida]